MAHITRSHINKATSNMNKVQANHIKSAETTTLTDTSASTSEPTIQSAPTSGSVSASAIESASAKATTELEQLQLQAQCHCGLHKFHTTATKSQLRRTSTLCQCNGCRHLFGSIYFSNATWPLPLPEKATTLHRWSDPRRPLWVYFCGTCGSQVFQYFHALAHLSVPIGLVGSNTIHLTEINGHQWLKGTGDGGLSEWLPTFQGRKMLRFARNKMRSENLQLGWTVTANPAAEEMVLAQCQCEGTTFALARPKDSYSQEERQGGRTIAGEDDHLVPRNGKYVAQMCACNDCRLSSGLDFMVSLVVPKMHLWTLNGKNLDLEGGAGTLVTYQSSPTAKRYFCGKCGALCLWETAARPAMINIALGIIYSASGTRAETWAEYTEKGILFKKDSVRKEFVEAVNDGYLAWLRARKAS